jgi:hypothetical protein
MPGKPLVLAMVIGVALVAALAGDLIIRGLSWVIIVWLALLGMLPQ